MPTDRHFRTFARSAPVGAAAFLILIAFWGATAQPPEPAPNAKTDPAAKPAAAAPTLVFARDVRPILASHCFKCHGPDEATRKGGLRLDTRDGATLLLKSGNHAVMPGDADSSALLNRVTTDDPDERMPPPEVSPNPLAPTEIALLRQWIEQGAAWSVHWSFVPPQPAALPPVSNPSWCRQPMDHWVLAGIDSQGFTPSPEAPRATLLRRVTLDLTGLPPTAAETSQFAADNAPDAYERAVNRLLASPAFGEKWARWWLDLARYADTKGYEKDERRSMWPYRDWVIRSLNADMPMDRFALEQLAGDTLPGATQDQVVATGFHRNTMTNDEGGTDNEEFRTAAVIDRVNTTMEIWQGLTAGCAQCHTHKYDPVSQTEYYRLFAIFNNTADADKDPEEPFLKLVPPDQQKRFNELTASISQAQERITKVLQTVTDAQLEPAAPLPDPVPGEQPSDQAWIDDQLSSGSQVWINDMPTAWPWYQPPTATPTSDTPAIQPIRGTRCWKTTYKGTGQVVTAFGLPAMPIAGGEKLFGWVYLDPKNPPQAVMFQWMSAGKGWSHRAYWGKKDLLPWAKELEGTPARLRLGDLPALGAWVRLEVDAKDVALEGEQVTGWAFSQHDGTVYWDAAGVVSRQPGDWRFRSSFSAWLQLEKSRTGGATPESIRPIIAKDRGQWSQAEVTAVRDVFARTVHAGTMSMIAADESLIAAATAEQEALLGKGARLPIMQELTGPARRTTKRFERGSYLSPAEEVAPGVPAFLLADGVAQPTSRAELATWLFSTTNPLTGRVLANRVWEQLFGVGLVETVEDFGTQGFWPQNQELIDHLALEMQAGKWSLKSFLRKVVTSATYRQSSAASPELLARDAANKWLARGPRVRLDGEIIRDQALAAAGLLSHKMFGPSVFPAQPDGLWIMIYSGDKWQTSEGEDRHRRSLYTFWRRTVPHPAMTTFDAPSREVCVSRRIRTCTPLQAFVTLNDPEFVECAQALARFCLAQPDTDDAAKITTIFQRALARNPSQHESTRLISLLSSLRQKYRADAGAATAAATSPIGPPPAAADTAELAAWSSLCGVVLNLDEFLTKE